MYKLKHMVIKREPVMAKYKYFLIMTFVLLAYFLKDLVIDLIIIIISK